MRRSSAAAAGLLREALSGAVIGALSGVKDVGEMALVKILNLAGGDHLETSGDADVFVHYEDALSGHAGIARLFIPGNVLFALPDENDTAMIGTGVGMNGPGGPYIFHGDAGDASRVPSWLRTKIGLFTKKILRLESKENKVEITANNGTSDVVLNEGTLRVAREMDTLDVCTITGQAGPYPVIFTIINKTKVGNVVVPGTPSVGPSASVTGVIAAGTGAEHVKA
jgi:hypothetical protein